MSTRQDDIASGAGDERMLERTVTIRESRRVVWISAGSALLPALLSLVSVRIVGRTTDASMAMLGFSALIVVIGLCVAGLARYEAQERRAVRDEGCNRVRALLARTYDARLRHRLEPLLRVGESVLCDCAFAEAACMNNRNVADFAERFAEVETVLDQLVEQGGALGDEKHDEIIRRLEQLIKGAATPQVSR